MDKKAEKRALTPKDFEERYGVSVGHLANMRSQRRGPKYFKAGGKILYKPEDADAWAFANPVRTIDSID